MTVNDSKRNQPSDRDKQARCKLQEKTLDFHANFYNCVYLSIGPEAKRDIYNTFEPDKPISIHLDPSSTERTALALTDSDTSDIEVNPRIKTSVEEREYNPIPGSATATQIALSHSRPQANLTIEHGPLH